MKRITHIPLAFGFVLSVALGVGLAAVALAASNPTPTPNSAVVTERVFNDCPTSTVTTVNNYPSLISIHDQNVDCFGFANLHVWHFSEDGVNEAVFDNNSSYRFAADFKIEGSGNGEGGLQIAPWWSHNADGLFNVRSTDGEIAVFGGRLPFYSFSNAPHLLRYTKGTVIHLEMIYEPRWLLAGRPATVEYKITYNGVDYTSGPLAFDMANPAEDPPHGLWGMLNDGRVGGHFKAFLGQGNPVDVKASFTNITFSTTPIANSAVTVERVFNDCPTSTLVTVNNYPSLVSFHDQNVDCFGFANLHVWRLSENGVDPAIFNNSATFRFSADFKIEGSGNGEGGLQIAPWWSTNADGLFNVRSTDGEIAVFGGRLPFYSFSNAPNLVRYTKGNTIHLEMVYVPNGRSALSPATVEYRLRYNGTDYTSGPLPFDEANPAEEPQHAAYGMLNDGQAGGHFKAFLGQGNPVDVKASFTNIRYTTCDAPLVGELDVKPSIIHAGSKLQFVTAFVSAPAPYESSDIDLSSLALNGVPAESSPVWVLNHFVKVKFDRAALVATLPANQWAPVKLTGKVGGDCFEAETQVKVKGTHIQAPSAGAVLAGGSETDVLWTTDEDTQVSSVTLLSTFDGGATWNVEAEGLANTGSYRWTVPNVTAATARLAVSMMVEQDETGPVNEIDVAESDDFSISSPLAVGTGQVELAINGIVPNPGRGLNVQFSLPTHEPATLAAYDVSGRQVSSRNVGSLGVGRHTVSLARQGQLPVGVYLVRLTQGSRHLDTRAIVTE